MVPVLLAGLLAVPDGYEWRPILDAPEQQALYHDGRQVGAYDTARDVYRSYDPAAERWGERAPCPIARPKGPNFGLVRSKLSGRPRYQHNGKEVSRTELRQLLAKDPQLPDDAHKYRLTVIGLDDKRARVVEDLQTHPALAAWKDKTLVQSYAPGHWKVVRDGFVNTGAPTIYLQAPSGEVLHRQDDYQGGAEALGNALAKADPNYKPEKDRDLRLAHPFAFPPIPWSVPAVALLAAGILLYPRQRLK